MPHNFKDVKAGDTVIIHHRHGVAVGKVERTTATQFLAGGMRFRKVDGYRLGGTGYFTTNAEPATPERLEEVKRAADLVKRRAAAMQSVHKVQSGSTLRALPLDKLEALAEAIERVLAPTEEATPQT